MKTSKILIILSALTALTAMAIVAVLLLLVQGVSDGANQLDDEKSKQAINATLMATLGQTSGLVADNAKWDDAVTNAYVATNSQWLFDTWGYASTDSNYDVFYILDENKSTIVGYADGKILDVKADVFFGPSFQKLISTLPDDTKTFAVASSFINTQKGISAVAVAPILPSSDALKVPTHRPRLLVFSKTLSSTLLENLGDRMVIKGLQLANETSVQTPSVPLKSFDGTILGNLTWTPERPGDKAKSAIQWPALLSLATMIMCMIFLTVFSGRLSSRLQKSEGKAWAIANQDVLTQLPNRLSINAQLEARFQEIQNGNLHEVTVLIADLDGFKEVNDTYGHQIGDELLKQVAAGLQTIATGFSGVLGRLGGDEFAFIVCGANSSSRAQDISKTALAFLGYPIEIEGRTTRVGISIGIATSNDPKVNSDELIRRADVAMYTAKERGKNQYYIYHTELDNLRNARAAMAVQLEKALALQQIEVAFQPIVDAKSLLVTGVEALARWQNFDGTWVSPEVFIKIAEEFGQVEKLGEQVLSIACREAAAWPDLNLSVNISPAQFRNPAYVDTVMSIVNQSGIQRNRLELEVTEGYLIHHHERARPIIDKLRTAGFSVSLDDFGTGFSSIGYLRQYKFDKLKIDRSLVQGLLHDHSAKNIVLATTVLAQSLNLSVTAEGVESEEEAQMLQLIGCNALQGYYFGHPQSAAAISALLDRQRQNLASV